MCQTSDPKLYVVFHFGASFFFCFVARKFKAVGHVAHEVWSVKFKCAVRSEKCEVWSGKQAVRSVKCEVRSVKCGLCSVE